MKCNTGDGVFQQLFSKDLSARLPAVWGSESLFNSLSDGPARGSFSKWRLGRLDFLDYGIGIKIRQQDHRAFCRCQFRRFQRMGPCRNTG
jgi:hypothetical protein